ncbi:MAG: trypsin-like peptidase domain-containing protein, partial [Pirellulaceae bacterium]
MTLTLPRALSGSGWWTHLVVWGIFFAAIGLLAARGQDTKPRLDVTIGGPVSNSVTSSPAAGVDEKGPATPGTLGARKPRQRATRPEDKSKRQDKPAQQVPRAEPPETPTVSRRGGELYERLLRSTAWVVIRSAADPDSLRWGTGWVLDAERRLLITNQHVVSGGADAPDQVAPDDEVRVYFPQRRQGELVTDRGTYLEQHEPVLAEIFDVHVLRDLAVLRLASLPPGTTAVELARHGARPGDSVHSLGNPGASDALWVYTSGTVRQVYRARSTYEHGMVRDFLRVETQSPTNPGDSGGPVVNEQGELVAVNQGYTEGRLISWFIDVSEVRDYLASLEPYWAPASAEAFNDRGVHYYECGRYDRAAADFTEAIVRDAKLADA